MQPLRITDVMGKRFRTHITLLIRRLHRCIRRAPSCIRSVFFRISCLDKRVSLIQSLVREFESTRSRRERLHSDKHCVIRAFISRFR